MTSRKPLGAERIMELRNYADACINCCEINPDELRAMLDMLTPPPDAELREAVEWLEGFRRCTAGNNAIGRKDFILEHIETLLRAVQLSPGEAALCEEHGLIRGALGCYQCTIDRLNEENIRLRAAFGLGEVGE